MTACKAMIRAIDGPNVTTDWSALLPSRKHAPTSSAKATALAALVINCTLPLVRTLRQCTPMSSRTTAEAIHGLAAASGANTAPTDSAKTIAIAGTLAQVEIQSLQPTANPG